MPTHLCKHGLDFIDAVLDSRYRLNVERVRGSAQRMQSLAYVFDMLAVPTVVHMAREDALQIVKVTGAARLYRAASV
ncbi:MAG: BrnT family toxin [Rhodocyclaceae bacterium]|nr:BrnT family toxin [Rhodocyclaceae bacterium]